MHSTNGSTPGVAEISSRIVFSSVRLSRPFVIFAAEFWSRVISPAATALSACVCRGRASMGRGLLQPLEIRVASIGACGNWLARNSQTPPCYHSDIAHRPATRAREAGWTHVGSGARCSFSSGASDKAPHPPERLLAARARTRGWAQYAHGQGRGKAANAPRRKSFEALRSCSAPLSCVWIPSESGRERQPRGGLSRPYQPSVRQRSLTASPLRAWNGGGRAGLQRLGDL